MQKRLFDYDPVFGITKIAHLDDDRDLLHIETIQDLEPIIEQNKAEFNSVDERSRHTDGISRVACIPLSVLNDLQVRGIWKPGLNINTEEGKRFRDWLNDRDNRVFRVRPGKI